MPENLTQSTEDYLKAIYDLTLNGERATTNQIAEQLGVKPASVTGMLKRLAASEPPLLEYRKHQGAGLTEEGRRAALEIVRHHRLLELFLHETLGYSWDEVHVEADRLEHVLSEEMEERIARVLGDPMHDPHGEPIPNRELHIWLSRRVEESGVRGVVYHAYAWCDLWHAEAERIRQATAVPMLALLQCDGEEPCARTENRIEAFVEVLR